MNKAMKRAKRQAREIKTRKNKRKAIQTWCRLMKEAINGARP